jgi:hypothetical protein
MRPQPSEKLGIRESVFEKLSRRCLKRNPGTQRISGSYVAMSESDPSVWTLRFTTEIVLGKREPLSAYSGCDVADDSWRPACYSFACARKNAP